MKTGIELIAEERQKQIEKLGRSIENDAMLNTDYQLTWAASALLTNPESISPMSIVKIKLEDWDQELLDKMDAKPYQDRLIIAGALIAAEIDRLNYKSPAIPTNKAKQNDTKGS